MMRILSGIGTKRNIVYEQFRKREEFIRRIKANHTFEHHSDAANSDAFHIDDKRDKDKVNWPEISVSDVGSDKNKKDDLHKELLQSPNFAPVENKSYSSTKSKRPKIRIHKSEE